MSLWDKKIEDMTPQENFEHFNYDLIPAYMNCLTDEQKADFMNCYNNANKKPPHQRVGKAV